jgi:hypothetical protein
MSEPKEFTFRLKAKFIPTILDLLRNQMKSRELSAEERMLREICEFVETVTNFTAPIVGD